MSFRKLAFLAFTLIAACRVVAIAVTSFVERAVAFLAAPFAPRHIFAVSGGDAFNRAASYEAPPVHFLRHEAGTSRRAAERHV